MMRLSKRLETVVSMAKRNPGCNGPQPGDVLEKAGAGRKFVPYRVADVGTDHGYVPVALALRDPAVTAIAMDVRPGPLERAREHIAEYGLEARIETRLGDGVKKLEAGEADTVVIAGMGGELVIHILEGGRRLWDGVERWILSPQSELDKVRRYLDGHEFAITDEVMVEEDGKYYTVMEVRHSDSCRAGRGEECPAGSHRGADLGRREAEPADGKASNEEQKETISAAAAEDHILKQTGYLYGPRLIEKKDPVLLEFLEKEERQLTEIMDRLTGQDNPKTAARREELRRKRDLARSALEKVKSSSEEGNMSEVSLSVRDEPDIGSPPQEQRREE